MMTKLTTVHRLVILPGLAVACWLLWLAPLGVDAQNYTLSIYAGNSDQQPAPVPTGTVSVQPNDNSCSSSGSACQFSYLGGTPTTLLASAPRGFSFQEWFELDSTTPYFGTVVSTDPVYSLTMNVNRTFYASFVTNTSGNFTLTVYKGVPGLGNGTVTGTAGFSCGINAGASSQAFANGTVVTLTNHPTAGWSFAHWEYGGAIYTGPTFTLTLDRDQLVQAIFTQSPVPPVVNVISPADNTSMWACVPVKLAATASAGSGWITKMEFFLGSTNGTNFATQYASATPVTAYATWWIDAVGVTNTFVVRATDNNGAQTVSSPASVITTSPPLLHLLDGITNRQCELCMSGVVGRAYSVLATTNFTIWTNIGTMTGTNTGFLTFVDPAFTNLPHRFYRAGPQTDLADFNHSISTTNVSASSGNTAFITVTNGSCSGGSFAAGHFNIGFYWSSTPSFAGVPSFLELPLSGCAANGIVQTNVPFTYATVSAGTYYLGYRINDLNEVPECNTSNNGIFTWAIKVQ